MSKIVNSRDLNALLGKDNIFKSIHKLYGPPPNWQRPPGFVSLSRIILEQQVSLESARAHFIKLQTYLAEYTPAAILNLSDNEMRQCQISRQKASYLRSLSEEIIGNKLDLEKLGKSSPEKVRKELTSIKGIGEWTVNIYLIFCLRAKDIFPPNDVALITTIRELSNAKSVEEMKTLSEKWKPYRSLASYFLWHYYLKKRGRTVSYRL